MIIKVPIGKMGSSERVQFLPLLVAVLVAVLDAVALHALHLRGGRVALRVPVSHLSVAVVRILGAGGR